MRTALLLRYFKRLPSINRQPLFLRTYCKIDGGQASVPLQSDPLNIEKSSNRPVRGEPGKVVFGFIPIEWPESFYNKTGVTGFYTFCFTTGIYLISKEKYLMEHEYYTGLSIALLCYIVTTRFGTQIGNILDKEVDEYEALWNQNRENEKKMHQSMIQDEEEQQWSMDGQLMVVEAKREQVALQLEEEYRRRLMEVYETVKNYLDFHVTFEGRKGAFLQANMKEWILKKVHEALTPEFLEKVLEDCLEQLPKILQDVKNE